MIKIANDQLCPHCGRYANRGITIDAVVIKDDKVLLIKRGKQPDKGLWGIPGGYVGWDETVEDTVQREVKEETNLEATGFKLVGVYSQPSRHPKQAINIVYLVSVRGNQPLPGDDVNDVKWFYLDKLPQKMALDHKQNIIDASKLLSVKK